MVWPNVNSLTSMSKHHQTEKCQFFINCFWRTYNFLPGLGREKICVPLCSPLQCRWNDLFSWLPLKVNLQFDLSKYQRLTWVGHVISMEASWWRKNMWHPLCLSQFCRKNWWRRVCWPQMTWDDLVRDPLQSTESRSPRTASVIIIPT